jgi:esterase FrsA
MYTYPITAAAMFEDRTHQFLGFGVPKADVDAARAAISDMWSAGPGGWTYEWSRRAAAWPRCPSTSTAVSPPTDPC